MEEGQFSIVECQISNARARVNSAQLDINLDLNSVHKEQEEKRAVRDYMRLCRAKSNATRNQESNGYLSATPIQHTFIVPLKKGGRGIEL